MKRKGQKGLKYYRVSWVRSEEFVQFVHAKNAQEAKRLFDPAEASSELDIWEPEMRDIHVEEEDEE